MLDLPTLVTNEGFEVRKQGTSWGGNRCPSCGESTRESNKLCLFVGDGGKWRFKCHACGLRGDSADFIAAARGISLRAALFEVRRLSGGAVCSVRTSHVGAAPAPSANDDGGKAQAITAIVETILKSDAGKRDAQAYFRGRGISSRVFVEAWARGIVRALPFKPTDATRWLRENIGTVNLMAAGLLKQGAACPAAAFRPVVGVLPKRSGMEFRLDHQAGSNEIKALRYGRLSYPWWWRPDGSMNRLIVVEGLIDMLSLVEKRQDKDTAIMALPGANSWRLPWFKTLHERNPELEVCVGLDSDDAGDRTSKTMITALREIGLNAKRLRPESGKDWNEQLLAAA
jgi:DNA primase